MNPYPKTKDEWWQLLNDNWTNILIILNRFAGTHFESFDMAADKMKKERDMDMVNLLNDAWWNAPDKPWIHDIPGWGVLCDLCSEAYLLHEDQEV